MKTKIVLTAGLAALIATPAFAQKHTHHAAAYGPYAGINEPRVVGNGRAIGTDPDPQIRFELERDLSTYTTTN